MSAETEAVLFYGLAFPQMASDAVWRPTNEIHTDIIGSDGDVIFYAYPQSGRYKASLDTCLRLPVTLIVDPMWDPALRVWCERNSIPWPADGAGWHLGPGRF